MLINDTHYSIKGHSHQGRLTIKIVTKKIILNIKE